MRLMTAYIGNMVRTMMHYKWAFMVSMIADPIILIINIALFKSIYRYNNANTILGYSLTQMIWYFAGISFVWYFIWNFTDRDISEKIISGDLAVDLLRPVSVIQMQLGRAVALRATGVMTEFVPNFFIYSLLCFPDFMTPLSLIRFFVAVIMAFVLYFLINFLVGLSAFFIKSNFSLQAVKFIIISFSAGAYIPLDFLPKAVTRVLEFLPFQYLFYWPIQFLVNKEGTNEWDTIIRVLGMQLLWIAGLYLLVRALWSVSVKRFCGAGG